MYIFFLKRELRIKREVSIKNRYSLQFVHAGKSDPEPLNQRRPWQPRIPNPSCEQRVQWAPAGLPIEHEEFFDFVDFF